VEVSLFLPIDLQTTLLQSITTFCEGEVLCDHNAYKCSKCAERVETTRSYKLIKTSPIIIIIHLKRFLYYEKTKRTEKIKKLITLPELLDLTSYFNENMLHSMRENKENNILIYELYAVAVHLGLEARRGHVYAYVRSPDGL